MQKLQYCYQAAVGCTLLALLSGGSWWWFGADNNWPGWVFCAAMVAALLLNMVSLTPLAQPSRLRWSVSDASSAPSFQQLADEYLQREQAVSLPTRHCYWVPARNTLIWYCAEPAQLGLAIGSNSWLGLICQLKLQYQCQRVEVLWRAAPAAVDMVAALQADIQFIDMIELNRLKYQILF